MKNLNLNWLTAFLNTRNPMQIFGLFRKRRNIGGTMLVSLLALGGSALFYALRRGGNNQMFKPLQNLANNVQNTIQNSNARPFRADFAEFANEIVPQNLKKNNTKLSQEDNKQ